MDVLLDNVCILCEEVTAILNPQCVAPYMKYLYSTFFEKSKEALQEFQTNAGDGGLCALCSHRVVIAHKFKDLYEDMCKKSGDFKKIRVGCVLCEQKGVDVLATDKNPNNFCIKAESFMHVSMFPTTYLNAMVCFDCIFYLDVWYTVFSYVQNKCQTKLMGSAFQLPTLTTRNKAQKKVHFNDDDTIIEINGSIGKVSKKESVSPRKKSPPPRSKPARRNRPGPLSTKKLIKHKRSSSLQTLKRQLKHLKSVQQIYRRRQWSPDVLENHKLYSELPYVLLPRDKIKRKLLRSKPLPDREDSKSPDLIEISDSDAEDSDTNGSKPVIKKKVGFKIKMSARFMAGPKSRTAKRKMLASTEYTCAVCDKIFSSLSEYKMHALWHEKPERPIINVVRSNFSEIASSSRDESSTDVGITEGDEEIIQNMQLEVHGNLNESKVSDATEAVEAVVEVIEQESIANVSEGQSEADIVAAENVEKNSLDLDTETKQDTDADDRINIETKDTRTDDKETKDQENIDDMETKGDKESSDYADTKEDTGDRVNIETEDKRTDDKETQDQENINDGEIKGDKSSYYADTKEDTGDRVIETEDKRTGDKETKEGQDNIDDLKTKGDIGSSDYADIKENKGSSEDSEIQEEENSEGTKILDDTEGKEDEDLKENNGTKDDTETSKIQDTSMNLISSKETVARSIENTNNVEEIGDGNEQKTDNLHEENEKHSEDENMDKIEKLGSDTENSDSTLKKPVKISTTNDNEGNLNSASVQSKKRNYEETLDEDLIILENGNDLTHNSKSAKLTDSDYKEEDFIHNLEKCEESSIV